tara:strand:- start:2685 stop:3380 length:696 start_codon:yes stop_codon:yes gene_type:complete
MKYPQPYIAVRFMTFSGFRSRWRAFVGMGLNLRHKISGKGLIFGKMLGSGAGEGFSVWPDWGTYAWFTVFDTEENALSFFASDNIFNDLVACSSSVFGWDAIPLKCHGTWNGINPFGELSEIEHSGQLAVLTRASIKKSQALRFWWNVPAASRNISNHPGLIFSKGVGEYPLLEQATLSLWNSTEELNEFAYKSRQHAPVVKKTRKFNWYSEELFLRMMVIKKYGKMIDKE